MRALVYDRFGGPEVLEVREIEPPRAGRGEILVRVLAAALNPKDVLLRKGKMRLLNREPFPRRVGYDWAGEAVEVGAGVEGVRAGDRLFGMIQAWRGGACAELCTVRPGEFTRAPKGLTPEQAASLPLAALTALQALRDLGGVQAGDEVCVNGASGGVGTLALQIAKRLGARVTSVSSGQNLELCRSLGADVALDYEVDRPFERPGAYRVLFDVFGKLDFVDVCGVLGPRGVFISTVPSWRVGRAALLTALGPKRARLVVVRSRRDDLELVRDWVEAGGLVSVVDRVMELDEAAEAQRYLETRRAKGKVVLRVGRSTPEWGLKFEYGGRFLEVAGLASRAKKTTAPPVAKWSNRRTMWQNSRVSDEANVLQRLASALRRVEEVLSYLPEGKAKALREKIATVRGVLLEQRPPRLVLIGRRGAGKSSLVNALFGAKVAEVGHVKSRTGQGRWYDYSSPSGTISILDTRGVQEGSTPDEADRSKGAIASIVLELKKKAPDLIVFLVKATEVDAAIDGDLQALQEIIEELDREHRTKPPLIAVATHCDLLEPKGVRLHDPDGCEPADLEEKLVHVATAERHLATKLRSRSALNSHLTKTMGVSSYLSFRPDGALRGDERWRIDALCEAIFRALPESGRGMFVRISKVRALQDELAGSLTRASAALCAAFAALPIPVADIVPLTTIQVALVAGIAWVSGRSFDLKSAGEFLSSLGINLGAAFALRETARALIKYVFPGAGSAVSGAIAFTGTMAIGAAARAYYLRGASLEEAKREFARAKEQAERDPEAHEEPLPPLKIVPPPGDEKADAAPPSPPPTEAPTPSPAGD